MASFTQMARKRIRVGRSRNCVWITLFVFRLAVLFAVRESWRLDICWPVAGKPTVYRSYIGPIEIEVQKWPAAKAL